MECWYRYKESRYSESSLLLILHEYPVLKTTPTGVWLDVFGKRRFCGRKTHKRFACPTKEEALESYRARKRRQVMLLENQLAAARAALQLKPGEREYFLLSGELTI